MSVDAPACPHCKTATQVELRYCHANNGVGWQCHDCYALIGGWQRHDALPHVNVWQLPPWRYWDGKPPRQRELPF